MIDSLSELSGLSFFFFAISVIRRNSVVYLRLKSATFTCRSLTTITCCVPYSSRMKYKRIKEFLKNNTKSCIDLPVVQLKPEFDRHLPYLNQSDFHVP
jgi:hypothetical protein